ncbi:MAG: aspartate aminotransferase family protein [Planctomycetaceae bacterium]|nr:aspartate aminotransferase family protein [Planctomycetaceae bacterium]MCB9938517.1 aspartate aminotransferase family protein [Planctomycetaceae bacterium]
MGKGDDLIARRAAITPRGIPMVTSATVASAHGATLVDLDGRELLDFASGIGVMNVGHCQPSVIEAIREQATKCLHVGIHVATYEPYIALCEKLAELLPHGDQTKVMLVNSGAEAVENAVKIARQATNRPAVICYTEGFHGRTLMAMSLTSKYGYKIGCGPYAPEVYRLPFPNHYRYGDGMSEAAFVERELGRFSDSLVNSVAAEQVAAVLLEPVQGEGGFIPVPPAYLRGLRKLCDEHGILMILDEVQSGFCRTGEWGAFQRYDVVPDISTWAKAMGGGLPIGAVVGKADVMDGARPGTIGGTYGGNPVACAASLETIRLMEELQLGPRATVIGQRITDRLLALQKRFPSWVGDVRGLGAMVGVELIESGDLHKPATELTADILQGCASRGLVILGAGIYGNVIRFLTPLVITDEQLDHGLDILTEEFVKAVERR